MRLFEFSHTKNLFIPPVTPQAFTWQINFVCVTKTRNDIESLAVSELVHSIIL